MNNPAKQVIIDDRVFESHPTFVRAIVIGQGVQIAEHDRELEEVWGTLQGSDPLDNPGIERVAAFDALFRSFGTNPKKFPPSVRQLTDRVKRNLDRLDGKPIPFINSLVTIMNIASLRHCLPVGGDDLDTIVGNCRLGLATGDEVFIPLGSDLPENPDPGEIIYFDDVARNVMCRRLCWRNGSATRIQTHSRHVLINVDGIGPEMNGVVAMVADEIARMMTRHCAKTVRCALLSRDHPRELLSV